MNKLAAVLLSNLQETVLLCKDAMRSQAIFFHNVIFYNSYLLWLLTTLKVLLLLTLVLRPAYDNFRTSSRTSERDLKIFRLNIHFCLVHLPIKKYSKWICKYDFLAIFTYEATANLQLKIRYNFCQGQHKTHNLKIRSKIFN